MTITACIGCGKGLECECGFSPEEKVRRHKEAHPFDSGAETSRATGVHERTVQRILQPVTMPTVVGNVTEGYDPKVKTERVTEFVALWNQMDDNEHDHVIRLILKFNQGVKIS